MYWVVFPIMDLSQTKQAVKKTNDSREVREADDRTGSNIVHVSNSSCHRIRHVTFNSHYVLAERIDKLSDIMFKMEISINDSCRSSRIYEPYIDPKERRERMEIIVGVEKSMKQDHLGQINQEVERGHMILAE